MPRKNPFEQSYRHTSPMVDVESIVLSNTKKLIESTGVIIINCDNCFLEYETQACWAKRTANHFCSQSCAGEFKAVEIKKACVICGSGFITNPTTYFRHVTCSSKCKKVDRKNKVLANPIK